jgi:hypothetical protein
VNPETGARTYLNNISGHRDVNATACPGNDFYATFPQLRQEVANKIAASTGSTVDHTAPGVLTFAPMVPGPTGALTIPFGLIFKEPVSGLDASDFTVGGTSTGWSIDSVAGSASLYKITLKRPDGPPPDEGTVTLTLAEGSVTDRATNVGPLAPATATIDFVHDADPPTVVLYQTPHKTLSNSAFFDWSAAFNEPVLGFDVADVALGGTTAGTWSILRIYGQDSSYGFSTDQAVPTDGTLTVQIPAGSMTDLAGNPNVESTLFTITVDRHAPTTGSPVVTIASGTTLSGSAVRVNLAWSATDVGPAGIASYDLARSIDGGAFTTIATGLTSKSLVTSMAVGHAYRFEVRGKDKAGNIGTWHAGSTIKASLTQQTSTLVHFSGSSLTTISSVYSGGSERYLRSAGSSASYTTTARSLSFVTTLGPTRGSAKVYIDGVYQATINLNRPTTTYREVAFTKSWSVVGTHTIKIVAVATPYARVDIDAFAVLR